jgi:hypothetical protein
MLPMLLPLNSCTASSGATGVRVDMTRYVATTGNLVTTLPKTFTKPQLLSRSILPLLLLLLLLQHTLPVLLLLLSLLLLTTLPK